MNTENRALTARLRQLWCTANAGADRLDRTAYDDLADRLRYLEIEVIRLKGLHAAHMAGETPTAPLGRAKNQELWTLMCASRER